MSSSLPNKRQRDVSLPCICGCEKKRDRLKWEVIDCYNKPLGVYLMKSGRFHAIYYNVNEANVKEEIFLGCYIDDIDAAKAWDAEVRKHPDNFRYLPLNYPESGENHFRDVFKEQFNFFQQNYQTKRIFSKPGILAHLQGKWQMDKLSAIMNYPIPTSLNQEEDRGLQLSTQLCFHINHHAYSCKKTHEIHHNGRTKATRASAMEVFLDTRKGSVKLLKCIRACIEKVGLDSYIHGVLAGELAFLDGSWIMNFPSTIAAYIYKRFNVAGGVVYDSSGGWGGRLCGAIRAGVKKYICCEPCDLTRAGLFKLKYLILKYIRDNNLPQMEIEIHSDGSENFVPSELVDMSFTSPPYFNLELYCNDITQSSVNYPTIIEWKTKFLQPTIMNTINVIKPGGYMIFNVADSKMYTDKGFSLCCAVTEYALSTNKVEAVHHEGQFPACLKYQNREANNEKILIFRKLA